jgi:TRAP-type mannitol/chloroaromatic compound transport system substrate-binding protein
MKNIYADLTHKITKLEHAEKTAENPEIKKVWESKIIALKEKRTQWLHDKCIEIKRRKGE